MQDLEFEIYEIYCDSCCNYFYEYHDGLEKCPNCNLKNAHYDPRNRTIKYALILDNVTGNLFVEKRE